MRRSKYHAVKVTVDGITFDSKAESKRYVILKEMEGRGEISNLRRQVSYELVPPMYEEQVKKLKTKDKIVNKCVQRAVNYKADFVYEKDGKLIVEDVKGGKATMTQEFKLKRKLMKYVYNIDINIV